MSLWGSEELSNLGGFLSYEPEQSERSKVGLHRGQAVVRQKFQVNIFVNKFDTLRFAMTKFVKWEFTHYFRSIEVLNFSDFLAVSSFSFSYIHTIDF